MARLYAGGRHLSPPFAQALCAGDDRAMSKLSDYSKFDHLDSDSDSNGDDCHGGGDKTTLPIASSTAVASAATTSATTNSTIPTRLPPAQGITKPHPKLPDRYVFTYNNQKVYEWEQSLDDVTIYISAPMSQLPKEHTASYVIVNILPNQLQVGLKGTGQYFINEKTFSKVRTKDSSWYLDDEGIITILLSKVYRGETWEGILCGHAASSTTTSNSSDNATSTTQQQQQQSGGISESIDPITKQAMQRTLMLERFQEENPGFDFRDATFNGEVPDARNFMGGVNTNH